MAAPTKWPPTHVRFAQLGLEKGTSQSAPAPGASLGAAFSLPLEHEEDATSGRFLL